MLSHTIHDQNSDLYPRIKIYNTQDEPMMKYY